MSFIGHAQVEKFKGLALQAFFPISLETQKVCPEERTSEARERKVPQSSRKFSKNWRVPEQKTKSLFQKKFQGQSVCMPAV